MMQFIGAFIGGAAGAVHNNYTQAVTRANNRLGQLNTDAKNKLRVAGNAATASRNTLDRWVQSVNNNRRLDSGGNALEANTVNARRVLDRQVSAGLSASVEGSERLGQMAASAAFSGVEGGVVDMVNSSVVLRDTVIQQQLSDSQDQVSYDVTRRAGNIMSQMVGGLDNSMILDALDYNIDVFSPEWVKSSFQAGAEGVAAAFGAGGAFKSSDQATKDEGRYNAAETHGTDFSGNAKFDFTKTNDRYLSLDSNADSRDWADATIGRSSDAYQESVARDAWRSSGSDMGGRNDYFSW